ncbi:hypothetical protein OK016_02065 [Vibrio chagasii]|nr:hypothetical protein [Vibrio chagasii]
MLASHIASMAPRPIELQLLQCHGGGKAPTNPLSLHKMTPIKTTMPLPMSRVHSRREFRAGKSDHRDGEEGD